MYPRLEEKILSRIQKDPSSPVLWWDHRWWGGEEFLSLVEESTVNLQESGITKGNRIAIFSPNAPVVAILSLAAWRLGATVVPLNSRGGVEAGKRIIKKIEPAGVIIHQGMASLMEEFEKEHVPCVVTPLEGPVPPFKAALTSPSDPRIAMIFATSGSTGNPKAVPLTHGNLLGNVTALEQGVTIIRQGIHFMNVLPNFHSYGYTVSVLLPLCVGAPYVPQPSFTPLQDTFQALEEAKVEVLVAVPTMLTFLLGAVEKGMTPPSTLKYVVSGGERLNPSLQGRVEKKLGITILQGYGLTECSPVVSCNPSPEKNKPGTVGPFLPGYEWEIRDQAGNLLDPSEEGVLWVRGPSVTEGYFRDTDMSSKRFANGWMNTGDVVRVDEEGYLSVLDRATDLIIVGGFNVYPQEIEAVLNEHPGVKAATVVGIAHHLTGEYPKAFVIPQEPEAISSRELIDFCKERLAHYKVPRKVEFVESFPLSGVGKVLRKELKKRG